MILFFFFTGQKIISALAFYFSSLTGVALARYILQDCSRERSQFELCPKYIESDACINY